MVAKISAVAGAPSPTVEPGRFGKVLESTRKAPAAAIPRSHVGSVTALQAMHPGAAPANVKAAEALERVTAAQKRLDQVLALAQSGKTFTPAELLAMQAQVYRASQELDLAGKVVEKATAGVKQVLQTQL